MPNDPRDPLREALNDARDRMVANRSKLAATRNAMSALARLGDEPDMVAALGLKADTVNAAYLAASADIDAAAAALSASY